MTNQILSHAEVFRSVAGSISARDGLNENINALLEISAQIYENENNLDHKTLSHLLYLICEKLADNTKKIEQAVSPLIVR